MADFGRFLDELSQFQLILSMERQEFFDKIKAREFTLKDSLRLPSGSFGTPVPGRGGGGSQGESEGAGLTATLPVQACDPWSHPKISEKG